MIDFSKIGTGNTVDTVLPPRDIFNALPKKNAKKFQYPRDVQSQVWTKWFARRDEESLVIKMNTGSGKTLVGLLILKSCLNEGKGPAVYIVPDNYLVGQVTEEAKNLGIEVTQNPNDLSFLKGESILVINIFKLINGKSVFGVGEQNIPIGSIIVDDAHAGLDISENQFSIKIPSKSDVYNEFLALFRESIK